jgi:hypothetical protein
MERYKPMKSGLRLHLLFIFFSLLSVQPVLNNWIPTDQVDMTPSLVLSKAYANELKYGIFPVRILYYTGTAKFGDEVRTGDLSPLFYAPFLYTSVAALSVLCSLSVLYAWKLSLFILSYLCVYGMFLLGRRAFKDDIIALIVAVLYLFSPYRFTDLFFRGAYAEGAAFTFIPWVFYFLSVKGKDFSGLLASALCLSLLVLTHQIIALYTSIFAAFFLVYKYVKRSKFDPSGLVKALLAYAVIALCFSAGYIIPVLELQDSTRVKESFIPLYWITMWTNMSPLETIISPVSYLRDQAPDGYKMPFHLGLTTLLAMASCLFILAMRFAPRAKMRQIWEKAAYKYEMLLLSLLISILIMFISGIPDKNIWAMLPQIFYYTQFPYRLMLFTSFFGCVLFGIILMNVRRHVPKQVIIVVLLITFASCLTYLRLANYSPSHVTSSDSGIPASYYGRYAYQPPGSQNLTGSFVAHQSRCYTINRTDYGLFSAPKFQLTYNCPTGYAILPFNYYPGYSLKTYGKETIIEKEEHGLIAAELMQGDVLTLEYSGTFLTRCSFLASMFSIAVGAYYILFSLSGNRRKGKK